MSGGIIVKLFCMTILAASFLSQSCNALSFKHLALPALTGVAPSRCNYTLKAVRVELSGQQAALQVLRCADGCKRFVRYSSLGKLQIQILGFP